MKQLIDVSNEFLLPGEAVSAVPHNSGHIHDTYQVHASGNMYILQQVNTFVFSNPNQLAENIRLVSAHLRDKAAETGGDPGRATISMIPTRAGEWLHSQPDGAVWRMFDFIPDTTTFEEAQDSEQVYQAGLAVGAFINLLSDFPAELLAETIPDFHNTPKRFTDFQEALKQDVRSRAASIGPEIEFILSREPQLSRLVDLLDSGDLPLRVTHNDTKLSNVLFDTRTGEAVCLIDLDTVMPGTLLYDFGDACRTLANTAAEDEPDLSTVAFNREYFQQFSHGFLHAAGNTLTPIEKDLLPFSALLMTLECGMRFLEDYLNGDIYFHTSRQQHNLQRARVQFRLVEQMEQHMDLMHQMIHDEK